MHACWPSNTSGLNSSPAIQARVVIQGHLNTEQALISLRLLTAYYVEVIFESEGVNTSESDSELVISIIEAFAQAENEARSSAFHL